MRALILEHAEHEGPGLLGVALAEAGITVEVARAWRGEPAPDDDGYGLLVVLGGPMAAWDDATHPWLAREVELLAARAAADRPTLGVCLGAQLLARALGARNFRGATPELGLAPITLTVEGRADALLAPLDGQDVLHWHQDTFALPAGATRLASTARYAQQAFSFGRQVYGLQFHVECDRAMRADWATRGADELRAAGVDPASLAGTDALDERGLAFARAWVERLLG